MACFALLFAAAAAAVAPHAGVAVGGAVAAGARAATLQ